MCHIRDVFLCAVCANNWKENSLETGDIGRCEAKLDPDPTQSSIWADLSLQDVGMGICGYGFYCYRALAATFSI